MSRGIKNNNPGNLRHGEKWQGLSEVQADKDFCTFKTAEYGIRALAVILRTYVKKYGLNTVRGIVCRYAPPNENDTNSYASHVAQALDVELDTKITLDEETLATLIKVIIKHENGVQLYSNETILKGITMS